MKKTNLFSITILTFLLVFSLQAQRPGGNRAGGGQGPQITVTGSIVDQRTNLPLEFATISLYSLKDSSLLSGGLTDLDGKFEITTRPGPQYAVAEFISYTPLTIEIPFDREAIRANKGKIDLGPIALNNAGIELEGVTVRAEKSETQFSLDKRVFNVGKDLANQGGSAEDILDNVPSVSVDQEGTVSLRGSEGVRILVDGKPSGLAGADNANGLRAIPANLIESVEVITNPSSRYEAEGTGGLINIILKKDKGSGFNGSFDVNGGYPDQAGIGANVNYRKGKVNWFANYGLSYRTGPGSGKSYQEQIIGDETFIQDVDQERNRSGINNSIRLGMDFLANDKETFTGAFLYRKGIDDNNSSITYQDYIGSTDNLSATTIRTDIEEENESNLEYSVRYTKEYSSRNHTLQAVVQYQDNIEDEGSDFLETRTFGTPTDDLIQRSDNKESNKEWLFQVDFKKPVLDDKGNFEIGIRSSLRNIRNDYEVLQFVDGVGESLPGLSNMFNYDEDVNAIYTQYGQEVGKFSFQLGLRAEHSHVLTELLQTNEVNDRNYLNLFPSTFLNYKFSDANALQVNYSQRIRRPRFWDLNPFFTFSDSRNTFSGNPNVNPEFTDSYEINFISYWDDLTLSSGIFYRHTTDVIQRILEFNEDGTTNRQPKNLGISDDTGFELTLQYSGLKWMRLNANANIFQQKLDVQNAEGLQNTDNLTWNARVTPRITLWEGSDLQIRFNYRGASQGVQGTRDPMALLDLGWSLDIMENSGTITFGVRDLFNNGRYQGTTIGTNFYRESEYRRRVRSYNVAFNYRINQKKQRAGRQEGGGGGGDFEGGEF